MTRTSMALASLFMVASAFACGYLMGHTIVGQPRTLIHAVSIQWKQGVSEEDKQKVLEGVRRMAEDIPGVKNVWIKSQRVEPRGFDDGFVIEFKDRGAADSYASSAAHKRWNDLYLPLRITSVSIDVSNP
jgi:hypothetical protein